MKSNVDFKNVVMVTRFDLLGGNKIVLPQVFKNLTEEQKQEHFQELFDLFHDVCRYLQAHIELDELAEKYSTTPDSEAL